MVSTINFHNKKPFGSIFKTKQDYIKWVEKLNKREVSSVKVLLKNLSSAVKIKEK
jgi:uncharacterized C2H2 Zn-finger protein